METARIWVLDRRMDRMRQDMDTAYALNGADAARAIYERFVKALITRNSIQKSQMENPAFNGVRAPEQGLVIG